MKSLWNNSDDDCCCGGGDGDDVIVVLAEVERVVIVSLYCLRLFVSIERNNCL